MPHGYMVDMLLVFINSRYTLEDYDEEFRSLVRGTAEGVYFNQRPMAEGNIGTRWRAHITVGRRE
jgi:hypothetical protein